MVKPETIVMFVAGLVLSVVGSHYWTVSIGVIPSLFAAGILLSVVTEAKDLAKEGIGHIAFDQKIADEGEVPDYTDFNKNFIKVIVAVILAVTLYSL